MAGSLEPKGVRSLRRIGVAVRSRLEPGETVRWAVYARTARAEVQGPFGRAVTGGIRVVLIATDRAISVFTITGPHWFRPGDVLARYPIADTPVDLEPERLRVGRDDYVLSTLGSQSDAAVLVDYVRAVLDGAIIETGLSRRRRSVPPMPGAFRFPQPVRSRSLRGAVVPAVVSLVVIGAIVLTSSASAPHEPAAGPPEDPGPPGNVTSTFPVCTRVALLDDEGRGLSFGDHTSYEGELGKLLPPTSPSGRMPVTERPLDLSGYAALKYHGWEWEAELGDGGFRRAYVRTWPRSLAEVTEFDSHEEALAFQAWADGFSCVYSDQVFRVDGVEGSSGLRILYSS
ncbi:MAG TPA: hypothetical protein VJ259_01535, partial [Actinomycetota bacterium]|nr:hypothetical protein [Actinomycetota bacterium]